MTARTFHRGDHDVVQQLRDHASLLQVRDHPSVQGLDLLDEVILVQQLLQAKEFFVQNRLYWAGLRRALHTPEHGAQLLCQLPCVAGTALIAVGCMGMLLQVMVVAASQVPARDGARAQS